MSELKKLFAIVICMSFSVVSHAYDFEVDGYRYTVITSSTAEFAGVNPEHVGEVIIPESVSYSGKVLSISTIGESAFYNYKSSFLRIPSYITLIKNYAFYNAQIDSLHFDDGDDYISLQNTINRTPSMSRSKLGSVYIGREISRTDYNSNADGPFYNSSVNKVYIGKSCSLAQELFQNCSNLESVTVKEGSYIKSISSECFRGCSKLKSIDLTKGLTSIASYAFYGCSSLDSIYIPSTVTSISSNAFASSNNITKVVSASDSPVSISETAFPGIVYLSSTLYVPVGTQAKYETTSGWKEFSNIVETNELAGDFYYFKFNLIVSAGGSVKVFDKSYSNNSMSTTVKDGDNLEISFKNDEGYLLKSLIVNGVDVTNDVADNKYLISSVNQNISVEVTFAELPIHLTIRSADNGTITQEVEKGKQYTLTIDPNEGWSIDSVFFNGTDIKSQMSGNRLVTPSIFSDSELKIVYKNSVIEEPVIIFDTIYIERIDTIYQEKHDTLYKEVPIEIHDSVYCEVHDTLYKEVPIEIHDSIYFEVHDTTIVTVPAEIPVPTIIIQGNMAILLCDDNDATIMYTTDGSDPKPGSAHVYTNPFVLDGSCTIKAISIIQSKYSTEDYISSKVQQSRVASTQYFYSTNGIQSLNPTKGVNIVVTEYDNGEVETTKEYFE